MIFFYFPFPNVCRDWSQNHSTVSADIKKLPSGGRIKRAGDDAAGLAVSEKRSDQIIRLETARKNVNDSLFQLAAMEDVLCRVLLNLATWPIWLKRFETEHVRMRLPVRICRKTSLR